MERAEERGRQFGIQGITMELTKVDEEKPKDVASLAQLHHHPSRNERSHRLLHDRLPAATLRGRPPSKQLCHVSPSINTDS